MGVKFDVRGVLQAASRLGTTVRDLATVEQRAIGTLRRRMPVETRRDVQQEFNLSASRISKGITPRAIEGGVEVTASGQGIGLMQYGARQTQQGVSYAVRKGERKTLQGAFIRVPAAIKATGPQVFVRATVGGKRAPRYPIERQYRLTIAQMLRDERRVERLRKVQDDVLSTEINRLLGKR